MREGGYSGRRMWWIMRGWGGRGVKVCLWFSFDFLGRLGGRVAWAVGFWGGKALRTIWYNEGGLIGEETERGRGNREV